MSEGDNFSFTWGLPILEEMGYTKLFNFMLRQYSRLGLTRTEMLCLIHLASYHYESPRGESRPSLSEIARQMGYGDRSPVSRLVGRLETKGMIEVTRRPGYTSLYDAAPFSRAAYSLFMLDEAAGYQVGGVSKRTQVGCVQTDTGDVSKQAREEEKKEDESQEDKDFTPLTIDDFPEPKPRKKLTTSEYKEHIAAALGRNESRGEATSWAVPAQAGGSDEIGEALLPIFCDGVGVAVHALPDRKAASWRKSLREVADRWGATVDEATTALGGLMAENGEFAWKTYSTPFQTGFQSDFELILGRVRSGKPLESKRGQSGSRKDPAFDDGANPYGVLTPEEWDQYPIIGEL